MIKTRSSFVAGLSLLVSLLSAACSDDASTTSSSSSTSSSGGASSSSSGGSSSSSSGSSGSTTPDSGGGSGTAPAAGKARCSLTFSNINGSNVAPDAMSTEDKDGSVTPEGSGGTIIACGVKGVKARGFSTVLLGGEVKAGAVFEMQGTAANKTLGSYASFEEIHQLGNPAARWTTLEVSPPAGKITITAVNGKSFSFKVEGVAMAVDKLITTDATGTFTVDGTGEATLQ